MVPILRSRVSCLGVRTFQSHLKNDALQFRFPLTCHQRREFSLPSRADTQPLKLEASGGSSTGVATWHLKTGCGLFSGNAADAIRDKSKRLHSLSPMIPADSVLRSALAAAPVSQDESNRSAVTVLLAEQTLSIAATGGAVAWVVRAGSIVCCTSKPCGGPPSPLQSLVQTVVPGDVVLLAADGSKWEETEVKVAATSGDVAQDSSLMRFRCSDMEGSDFDQSSNGDAPHPSWAQTIFNEFGTHETKK